MNDAWGFFMKDALYSTKVFAEHWYGLMVDFWLASVLGVAFYPYLGNRVWCRFFCPLRAYMELLAKYIGRLAIHPNDKCIGCGECTRFCQMGIPVQQFAQKGALLDNTNSACIQCGAEAEVRSTGRAQCVNLIQSVARASPPPWPLLGRRRGQDLNPRHLRTPSTGAGAPRGGGRCERRARFPS